MYASGGMYALSSEVVQLLTQVPPGQRRRRLSGRSDDVSVGLWVMAYNISYLDNRRLGVQYSNGSCPDDFIGEQLHATLLACKMWSRADSFTVCMGVFMKNRS